MNRASRWPNPLLDIEAGMILNRRSTVDVLLSLTLIRKKLFDQSELERLLAPELMTAEASGPIARFEQAAEHWVKSRTDRE